ncbi:MAG: hypothetical protein SOV91_04250 [Eubacteriales bacterium]|nr:hypothetical protein [Eubacteriales bacterium]
MKCAIIGEHAARAYGIPFFENVAKAGEIFARRIEKEVFLRYNGMNRCVCAFLGYSHSTEEEKETEEAVLAIEDIGAARV